MKKPYYLLLIALGITLFVVGIIVNKNTNTTEEYRVERTEIYDRILKSNGYVNATLQYPAELLINEEDLISLELVPDKNVKTVLSQGMSIDTLIAPKRLTSKSERRQILPINEGGTVITWSIQGTRVGPSSATVSLGLTDSRTDPTLYPIAPQHRFEINIPVVETKTKASFTEYIGLIMIPAGGVSLLLGFIIAGKDFDQASKQTKKKRKK